MPRKDVNCDQCGKEIRGEEIAYFSDEEKDLDFCSEECHQEWKEEKIDINSLANQWLIQKFPNKEERKDVEEINIKEKLEGELNLKDFTHWNLKVYLYPQLDHSQLKVINQNEDNQIIQLVEASKWLDKNYPQNETCKRKVEGYNFDDFGKKRQEITELNTVGENLSDSLDLTNFVNLEKANFWGNKLIALNLTKCNSLKELDCYESKLTYLDLSKNFQLRELVLIRNNFPHENPTWLSHLVNLKQLLLGDNNFVGSLEFTKNMNKLEYLGISGNNFTNGLEYLSTSLKSIECGESKIWEELALCGGSLELWQITHPKLMKKVDSKKIVISYENAPLESKISIPWYLKKHLENSEGERELNYNFSKLSYLDLNFRDHRPFSWEKEFAIGNSEKLPLRLYNIQTNQVEEISSRADILSYLTLSYCWGTDWEGNPQSYGQAYSTDLTKLGRKALNKVLAAHKYLKEQSSNFPNYIWIDNFCINQSNKEEKAKEVVKQKIYYGNSIATLIAIDTEIGNEIDKENELKLAKHIIKKIVQSFWFQRSWTFQEGLLSKQTIFMFDDGLVDGRILARVWAGVITEDPGKYGCIFKINNNIFVTPLGWSYGGVQEQVVNLELGEALYAVNTNNRQQTVPLDGIYSIIGLLPYGSKVAVNYKNKACQHNEKEQKDTNICYHSNREKDWSTYRKEELEQELLKTMKLAVKENETYAFLSWCGDRRSEKEKWWIPEMREDGSVNIEMFLKIKAQPDSLKITEDGVEIVGMVAPWIDGDYIKVIPEADEVRCDWGFCVLVPKEKKSYLPIRIEETGAFSFNSPFRIFINMISKEIITGEQAIQEYRKIKECYPNLLLSSLWNKKNHECENQVFDDSAIFQNQDKFYIWKHNQLREIVKNLNDEWEYKVQELQAQTEIPTKK